ncbi:hypothetical protein [Egicoccus halophilus]|uniref:hypothetical protein n=1 Tax=Egicoccus halophilus TaxID=1670830 RepID=UPI00102F568A|nr:hypothetical protein [Egicoccus halophilus]
MTPLGLVTLAGLLFGVLTVVTVGLDRELRWDEVTYLAQVTPGQTDVWFGPQRARGMSLVALPVALLGAPLTLLRLWLVLVSSVALVLAFRPWARFAGWTGGAAAVVAAVGWVPQYFAVELYPNLLAGLAAVATAGHLVVWCRDRRPRDLAATALALAVVAWLRPAESVWLAFGLTPVLLVLAGRRSLRGLLALAVGGFVGWLPWLVEAIVRFGGPFARLGAAAGESASGADRDQLIQYLNLVEGPVRQVTAEPVLTYRALALLVGLALLALLGVVQRLDRERRVAALAGLVTAAATATPYLVLNAGVNLRYVLPAMLLATLPVGAGVTTVVAALRRSRARATSVVVLVVALVVVGWQGVLARVNSEQIAPLQARARGLGEALAEQADGAPCAFVSETQWPEIQWHSGCLGEVLHLDAPLLQCHDARRDLAALAEDGHRVFALARGRPPAGEGLAGWDVRPVEDVEDGGWGLYERPADLGPTDPPTIPDPADSPTPCPPSRAPDASDARLELRWDRPA